MKNMKILGIIVMIAIIGFTMTACDGDDGVTTTTASLGDELKLTNQQVYTEVWNANGSTSLTPFNGNLTIKAISGYEDSNWNYHEFDLGGTGSVTAGKLNFTLGTPPSDSLSVLFGEDEDEGLIITVSDPEVKGVFFYEFSADNGYLYRSKSSYSETQTSSSGSYEMVEYVYVEKDVNVSAKKYTDTYNEEEDGITYKGTWTQNAFSINLKKGWNALCYKYTATSSFNAATNTSTSTSSTSYSASIPSGLNWIYDDDDYNDLSINYSILPSGETAPRSSFKPPRSIFGKK